MRESSPKEVGFPETTGQSPPCLNSKSALWLSPILGFSFTVSPIFFAAPKVRKNI
jgi:hypothetical protein